MKLSRHSLLIFAFAAVVLAQQPGPNVSVVSSDPNNQKQVEVAAAANPQNPNHVVAGFIDYQTVQSDNPVVDPTSNAWCGYSFSINGGRTWKNFLVPVSPAISGSNRCGDPAITWDTNGHMFYMGGAQLPTGPTTLFVARFTDPDDGSGTLHFDTAVAIASGNPSTVGQVPDKPSLAFVPDPTPGGSPSLPGTLYACGTIFNGTQGGKFRNKVVCSISADGGLTFSAANQGKINGNVNTNNGTAIALSPDGSAYVFWRAFLGSENGYWFSKVDRFGNATAPALVVGVANSANFYPYDAPTLSDLARSNAFPSVATDSAGRIVLAFQGYSNSTGTGMAAPSLTNTPRIFITYSSNGGVTWSAPTTVDYGPQFGNAFQFMPSVAAGGGGLISILYYDARNDGRPINLTPSGYLPNGRDRRFDVRVAQGQFDSSGNLNFSPSVQVNTYKRNGLSSPTAPAPVLDRFPGCGGNCPAYNLPNLPIAAGGTVPFIGDYIWLAPAVQFVRNKPGASSPAWRIANQVGDPSAVLAFFTSTQDVGFPFDSTTGVADINGDWTKFNPLNPGCINPKSRDSNIIFSLISPGISASWSGTSKALVDASGNPIPPEFVVTTHNSSNQDGFFRLTILDSPPAEDWSFIQTLPAPAAVTPDENSLDTQILANSSVNLPVYYRFRSSTNAAPTAPVQVMVQEINAIGGTLLNGGRNATTTYSTSPVTLQPNNIQFNNIQFNNIQFNNLQPNNIQFNNIQFNNASPSNVQVNNVQINNVQINNIQFNNSLIPDQDVTFSLTGTGSLATSANSIINVANGQDLLNQGYAFQLLVYQTQMNPDSSACSVAFTPNDVILSNIAITPQTDVNNIQVNNLQPNNIQFNNLQPNNSLISDALLSNATLVANPGEQVNITLRSFRPPNAPPSNIGSQIITPQTAGQASFTAVNPDGSQGSAFFDLTPPLIVPNISGTKGNNGWYRSAVTITWSVSDPQSGIASQTNCGPFTQTADTTGVTVTCSATNGAGLFNSVSVTIKIDTTPPTVTASISPATPAPTGWYNIATGKPVVTFTCTDTGSGVAGTCPAPVIVGDGANQTISSGVVTDEAGNAAAPVSISGINVDTTPPIITPNILPAKPAATGWYNIATGRPTVGFTCSDATSGLAAGACPAPVIVPDGPNQSITRTVTDIAGNTNSATISGINVDLTPPTITASISPANPAPTGWYNAATGRPTVSFACADAVPGSGVAAGACPSPVNLGDGANQSVSRTVTDIAGNVSTAATISGINVDATPPTITASVSPASPAPTGWYNAATGKPTISFTCIDNLSGLAGACPSPVVLGDGANQIISRSVMDVAGNTGTVNAGPFNVDTTPPVITVTSPANIVLGTNIGTYLLNAAVAANYSCFDAVSGLTACQAPVNSGSNFSTSSVGANAFLVTATDRAGNAASLTNIYAVIYNFILTPPKSSANLGSAVPLIWELTDANGAVISDLSSLVTLASIFNGPPVNGACTASLTGTSPTLLYSPATGATGGSNFRFIGPTFQFNWDTSTATATGKGCYTVLWQLKDNSGGPPNFTVLDPAREELASVQLN